MAEVGWFQVGGQGVIIADWLNQLFKLLDEEGLSYEGRHQVRHGMRTMRNGWLEVPLTFFTKEDREEAERGWLEYRKKVVTYRYLFGNT